MTAQPETSPRDHTATYNAVPAAIDLPAMEHEILDFWKTNDTFSATLAKTSGGRPWTFYEGPPTANGMPGTHHIEARVFKDVFPRFKTMQGYRVDRKAGWDCHGLPVELAVEKELGFNGKPDIEAYGVEAFNARCRESVSRHVDAFTELTTRMGYWVNLDQAYWTMDPSFVESAWWALKQIHAKGLLVEDYRVAPYCPRCGTTLSDHELAQGYEDVVDPSVYVRFPLTSGPLAGKASLLVWTTTPWTLVSNTAVAVHPDVTYVVATEDVPEGETLVIAEPLAEKVLGEGWLLGQTFTGKEMELWRYQRPFELVEFPDAVGGTHTDAGRAESAQRSPEAKEDLNQRNEAHYVVLADYVTTEDGTGLVHQAPAFGEDDMAVCRAYGLPFVNPIRPNGHFADDVPLVGGQFFKSADPALVDDLRARGLLFRKLDYAHSYPHCWRCHTSLIYYAQPSWYIRTTAIKDALLRENEGTNWYPENIKWGRYGDWLNNNIDWALSRSRYWGTPLPIWRCEDDHQVCVGSRAELSELTGQDLSALDPHRPFVDDVTFGCPTCGKPSHRVPEVIDAWFDSGSMPFGQWGYPWAPGSKEAFEAAYPADFICEAIDQTRGWFYSLMAVGTLVFDQSSYRNVLCLGHILAEDGRKMSKHLGNILEPIPLMDKHGADAVRWFMAAGGSPWSARRVGHGTIQETVRKVLMTYWNTVCFQALYARANDWSPSANGPGDGSPVRGSEPITEPSGNGAPPVAARQVLDRWLVSATNQLVLDVTAALDGFDTQKAGALLSAFVDDLSNWYVRRSRRRFWDGEPSALWTLHETLEVVTRLMAPLVPFITERVWQDLIAPAVPGAPASVHLADWPVADEEVIDPALNQAMALTRRIVELGRSARAEAKLKTRQPLSRALVPSAAFASLDDELKAEIKAELNVVELGSFASAGDLVDHVAKGNFRALGKRFGKQTPIVAAAIAAADAAALAAALASTGSATIEVPDLGSVELGPDDVIISERPREGWSVVNEQGETVALDLELTPDLVRAGLAREVVRLVQDARKSSGFDVSDRITLTWSPEDTANGMAVAEAIEAHAGLIADEVLAVDVARGEPAKGWFGDAELGLWFQVAKV
ncbi:MAG: isoleucine--tRNA ligase [Propionicimonas sp.]|nr:isoleucine--tRNA ligase [Propionicimonas sp.]